MRRTTVSVPYKLRITDTNYDCNTLMINILNTFHCFRAIARFRSNAGRPGMENRGWRMENGEWRMEDHIIKSSGRQLKF